MTATTTGTLRLGTRASQLATTQSQAVADAITAASGVPVQLVPISTEGDRSSAAIAQLGGTGVFVTAIRQALLEGTVDVAVHSYKDLPTLPEPGLTIAAVPPREDPRDALVARDGLTLGELPAGAKVGTGAPRRVAQLRALGLGLEVVPIRGNVDTRLARVVPGDLDAVVLARAGRQLAEGEPVTGDQRVARVLPQRHGRHGQPGLGPRREDLVAVHGDVDGALQQRLPDRRHEDAGATELRDRRRRAIALGADVHQLHGDAAGRGDGVGDRLRLGGGQPAGAGAQPERRGRDGHPPPPAVSSSGSTVTASARLARSGTTGASMPSPNSARRASA